MRTVTAKELLPSPRRGGASQSQLIRADDKQIYNVKFQQNDQGWRTLVNDLVGSQLASEIGVPVPESVAVIIDELFLEANPHLQNLYDVPVRPGNQFGSKFIDRCYTPPHPSMIGSAQNKKDFAHIIVFDVATNNMDRFDGLYDNVLLVPVIDSVDGFDLIAIDHGSCFGCIWEETIINNIGQWCKSHIPEMAQEIKGANPFNEALRSLERVTFKFAYDIVLRVPNEWGLPSKQELALAEFMAGQALVVQGILLREKAIFPNWMVPNVA